MRPRISEAMLFYEVYLSQRRATIAQAVKVGHTYSKGPRPGWTYRATRREEAKKTYRLGR